MRRRILCDAVPFGFGPAGKLAAVLNRLTDADVETVVVGSGTSAELLDYRGGPVVPADTESPAALQSLRPLFTGASLFINVMNSVSLQFAQGLGLRTVVVDSLFWMWDRIDPGMARSDRYFIQNFVGVEDRLREEKDRIRHPVLVGPIVDASLEEGGAARRNQLLVNLGGMESKLIRLGENLTYPAVIGRLLADGLQNHPFDRVLVTGSAPVMRELGRTVQIPRAEFERLGHQEFLAELKASRLFLTSPGLTATLEAFTAETPTAFLPPQNYSQFFNLTLLREARAASHSLHWEDLYGRLPIRLRMPEDEGVRALLGLIERFREDAAGRQRWAAWLSELVWQGEAIGAGQVERQRALLRRMGSNGALTIANAIKEMLV
jgi:hydroxymethylcytosylglucuronate/cytosylglucuronate synthase